MNQVLPMTLQPLTVRGGAADGVVCVDTEDAYQIVLRRFGRGPRYCRVQFCRGLEALLGVLDRRGCKATFFVLGMTAAEEPGLVGELLAAGHEVATHGFAHRHLESISLDEFADDLRRAIGELASMTGEPVLGHRAPEFSIPRSDPAGFFRVLVQAGLRYDSSVFPIAGRRYGLPGMPRVPFRVGAAGGQLIELPLATVRWLGRTWPVAGGGYWRLLPRAALRWALGRARRQGVSLTLYLHNYEFDPAGFDLASAVSADEAGRSEFGQLRRGWKRVQRRQNLSARTMPAKLDDALASFRLTRCRDFLAAHGWLEG